MTEETISKKILLSGYTIPFLLVFYVMTVGPAFAFMHDSTWRLMYPEYQRILVVIYTPLTFCAAQNKYLTDIFWAYLKFCNGYI
ncbi:MAG TPA: hypothetical protein DCM07_00235 [Planctomycetaceae bacterium]|nr:hypothetical protein [Gimesia sp.]HAH43287.1 hypothetical protein [Planctomycetaceae bacterium]HBL46822.1 hypothetical protein [Planctomycetaceae bacterium]|tara:strand:- start:2439 stop:2690 length:252 start_codon:yes stop_codon:yes gene_type:complete